MVNSKNFFYVALAIGILIFSVDKVYKFQSRFFMDNLYQNEFDKIYYKQKTNRAYLVQEIFGGKGPRYDLEMLEKKMVADGYTHAEVTMFKNKACAKYESLPVRFDKEK